MMACDVDEIRRLERVIAFTKELVNAESQNPPGNEAQCATALRDIAVAHGLTADVDDSNALLEPDRPNVILTVGNPDNGQPTLLLLTHLDVVPAGAGWTTDPFDCVESQETLVGRGTADTKGGLAAVVDALIRVKSSQESDAGTDNPNILVVAASDEEEGGRGTQSYLLKHTEYNLQGCIVVEPTGLQTIVACKGNAYYRIAFHGKSAHASNPDNGSNAIYAASLAALMFHDWHAEFRSRRDALIGPPTWNAGIVHGGNGTAIVPSDCVLEVDRRLVPGEHVEEIRIDIERRLSALQLDEKFGVQCEVTTTMNMPGFATDVDNPFVKLVHDAAAQAGFDRPLGGWRASCDGGFVADAYQHCPIVLFGPGDVATQAHRPNEAVTKKELVSASHIVESVMLSFLRGE